MYSYKSNLINKFWKNKQMCRKSSSNLRKGKSKYKKEKYSLQLERLNFKVEKIEIKFTSQKFKSLSLISAPSRHLYWKKWNSWKG